MIALNDLRYFSPLYDSYVEGEITLAELVVSIESEGYRDPHQRQEQALMGYVQGAPDSPAYFFLRPDEVSDELVSYKVNEWANGVLSRLHADGHLTDLITIDDPSLISASEAAAQEAQLAEMRDQSFAEGLEARNSEGSDAAGYLANPISENFPSPTPVDINLELVPVSTPAPAPATSAEGMNL